MICPICGAEIPDDALFCTKCGGKVDGIPQPRRRHSRVPLALGIIAVFVALAVGLFTLLGGPAGFGGGLSGLFSQFHVSATTQIVPCDNEGYKLSGYRVGLVKGGESLDVLTVKGDDGFALGDFDVSELPDGTYDLVFLPLEGTANDDQPIAAPLRVDYRFENQRASEALVPVMDRPGGSWKLDPAIDIDAPSRQQELYDLFSQKANEYQGRYGQVQLENASGGQMVELSGLCLAKLVDFNNDGQEELLLAYYDPSRDTYANSFKTTKGYAVEVWAVVGGELRLVHEQAPENSNGGEVFVNLYAQPDGTQIITAYTYGTTPQSTGTETLEAFAFSDDRFNSVRTIQYKDVYSDHMTATVDGQEVTSEEARAAADELLPTEARTTYCLVNFANAGNAISGARYLAPDVKSQTIATMSELRFGGTNAQLSTAEQVALQQEAFGSFPKSFSFSSGAGAWSTDITIQPNGTFTGQWHDTNMGENGPGYDATVHVSEFHGKFSVVGKASSTDYEVRLDYLVMDSKAGSSIENRLRTVTYDDAAYGIGVPTDKPVYGWHLYLPGQSTSGLDENLLTWVGQQSNAAFDAYVLYSEIDGYGWRSYE